MSSPEEITQLLAAAGRGEAGAMDRLVALLYAELRAIAHRQLRRRRAGFTLDTTALVNEAYLRLAERSRAEWKDRQHFLAVAAIAVRHVLVDAARRRSARKRGGARLHVTFDELSPALGKPHSATVDLLALDEALSSLAALNARLARLVELRFFGGLTEEEAAAALGISERTLRRDWRTARAFLFRALYTEPTPQPAP